MRRSTTSHKGENGSVAIIGGSLHQHGAPLFAALACEASGVDLVHLVVPKCHSTVTKCASNNFMVHTFVGNDVHENDTEHIIECLAGQSIAVIGPGLSRTAKAQEAIRSSIEHAEIPLVLDASALEPWTLELVKDHEAILTPHLGELSRMLEKDLTKKDFKYRKSIVRDLAREYGVTIILKGSIDLLADGNTVMEIEGGNAGLTVGGTGDALAGLIAGLFAQGVRAEEACVQAATIIKRAATVLEHHSGYRFTTAEVIAQIPHLLHTYEHA